MKYSKLALALSFAGISATVCADEVDMGEYEQISISASRVDRDINEIASSVTVIDSQQIDKQVATDIRDLVRFEPGVVVEGGGRFGLSGFNIRGINGDRVLMLLDGAPLADEFSFGPALSARRDFIDVDMIDRVEIIRGPASTLYGSDAIGGVVSFVSKDPAQLLNGEQRIGGKLKAGYASVADEWVANAQVYGVNGDWQWLLNATTRDGSENETFYDDNLLGSERSAANPQDNQTNSAQMKLIYQPSEAHRIEFLADYLKGETDTNVLSQTATRVRGTLINESLAEDERDRNRFQINYQFNAETPLFDKFLSRLYWQETESLQVTRDQRLGAVGRQDPMPVAQDRFRSSEFLQTVKGAIFQFDKEFTLGDTKHYLIYGSELQFTDSEALREGWTRRIDDGSAIAEFSTFPARDFPMSDAREMSFFIQDEISLLDGQLTLSPGLRYDDFELDPNIDPIFTNANPGVSVVPFDDSQVSLKLGAVYDISENTNIWAQFAEGFRIPPFDDLNVGFTNFMGRYTSLPNPNLKPESVESWEIGLRQNLETVSWSISTYRNNYDNFIESRVNIGTNDAGFTQFQAANRDDVVIEGIDAQLTWFMGESLSALQGWQVQAALTWLQSEDKATGQEIESILPPQAVLGLGYTARDDSWSVELIGTFVERFDTQIDETTPNRDGSLPAPYFQAPGYAQFDLLANMNIAEELTLNVGIFNLFDREVWNSTETIGVQMDGATNLGFLTSAGRNFAVNMSYQF